MTYLTNNIKELVQGRLIKQAGIPVGSRAALDLEESTEEAIEFTMIYSAQEIFAGIEQLMEKLGDSSADAAMRLNIERMKDRWLHNVCDVCSTRLPSTIVRKKDKKQICARCAASEPYTKEEIHGIDGGH